MATHNHHVLSLTTMLARHHDIMHHPTGLTKKHTTRLWALALALVVCSLLTTGCRTASLRPSEMLADSISGFSGTQGANGWSYGYWDRTADTDRSYGQTTDFQLLRHFGSDPINGLSSRSDFTTGKLWILQDGRYYTALWAEGGSSNGTTELAAQAKVEQWAVRRWVSTANGPVTISGHVAKILPWGVRDSGRVHIVVDGATVFSAALDPSSEWPGAIYIGGTNYSVNATVHIGSLVDFFISPAPPENGGAFGPVKFTATIRAAP